MVALLGALLPFSGQITIGGLALTTAAGGLTLAGSLLNIAGSALLQEVGRALGPRGPRPENVQINTKQVAGVRMAHVGRVKVGGNVVFHRAKAGESWRVIVHGHGGADGVESWYLNNVPVTLDGDGWVTDAQYSHKGQKRLRLQHRLGAVPSSAYDALTAVWPEWTADHRLDGQVTSLVRAISPPPSVFRSMFPAGEPEVQALLRGQAFPDPRLAGALAFTENAALIIAGYIGHADGLAQPDAVDADDLLAEANLADLQVPLAAGGTEAAWRLAGSWALTEPPQDVLRRMLDAVAGRMKIRPNGKIGLRLGNYRAPAVTLRFADLADAEQRIGFGPDRLDRYNVAPARYVDAGLGYIEVDAEAWRDEAAIAADGEELVGPGISALMAPSHRQVRLVQKITTARANARRTAHLLCKPTALAAAFEDEVTLDMPEMGLTGVFEVRGHAVSLSGGLLAGVTLDLRQVDPAAFSQTLAEQGSVQALPPADEPSGVPVPDDVVAAGAGVQVSANTFVAGIAVAWSAPPSDALMPEVRWRVRVGGVPGDEWFAHVVGEDAANTVISGPLTDLAYYDVEVRFRTPGGVQGAAVVVENVQAIAATTPPAAPAALSVSDLTGGRAAILVTAAASADLWKTEIRRDGTLVATSYAGPSEVVAITDSCGAGTFDWTARSINVSGLASASDIGPITQTIT